MAKLKPMTSQGPVLRPWNTAPPKTSACNDRPTKLQFHTLESQARLQVTGFIEMLVNLFDYIFFLSPKGVSKIVRSTFPVVKGA